MKIMYQRYSNFIFYSLIPYAYDGNLVLDTYIPKKYKDKYLTDLELVPFNVETDSESWPPPEDRKDLKVKIRWNKGVSLYDYNKLQMLPSEENVFGSDAKLRKRHLYFDKWLPFKNNFLVNPRLYLAKESPGKSKISFSCNTGSFFKPEILKERIYINGYRVKFTEHEDQLNGFDQVESSDIDYISVNGDFGETKVYVEIEPFETGKFWAISSDPTLITINGESCKEITSEKMELQINVVDGTPTPERKCYVWIRAGSLVRGTMLKELNVMIYKQKNVDKIYFERVTDLSSPKTHISDIVSSTDILNDLNNYYKQAVIYVGDIIGKENDTCAVNFDLNGNGALDYYYDGANPEFDSIKTRFQTGQVKIAQVNNFKEVWRVDPTVSSVSKTSHVKLEGVSYLETSSTDCYYFGKQGDVFEKVYVIKVNDITNVITFKTPLVNTYDNSDGKIELFGSLGGLSAEPVIVTKGNRLPFIIGHELLHKTLFGHLLDVSEEDNLMYYRVKENNVGTLRYRKQTNYYKNDIGKSGFDQWSDINRTDIVGGE